MFACAAVKLRKDMRQSISFLQELFVSNVQKIAAIRQKCIKFDLLDILKIPDKHAVPADCILLASSDLQQGLAYVETSSLDG